MRTNLLSGIVPAVILCAGIQLMIACTEKRTPAFSHSLPQGPKPWLHENFDDGDGQFTFAIVSDLNGGEREGIFDVAIEQANLLRPELIVTVGDLVEGGTESRDTLKMEYDRFDMRAGKAKAPLFHVGGNHDLTNPVMRKFWVERYGARYYYFIYKDVLFLMLDSGDYNEARMQEIYLARAAAIKVMDGPNPEKAREMEYFKMPERVSGEISKEQSDYFDEVIRQHPEVSWTLLFMHKPVWKREDSGGWPSLKRRWVKGLTPSSTAISTVIRTPKGINGTTLFWVRRGDHKTRKTSRPSITCP